MKRLILWLALLLPFFANAQVNGTIQKTVSTGMVRGSFGSNGLDTLPRVTGALVDGYILKYNASTNKWYASPDPTSSLYWQRSGGTLSPINSGDSINIGTGIYKGHALRSDASDGVQLQAANGTLSATFGVGNTSNASIAGSVTVGGNIIKTGGTGAQFLMANGTTQDTTQIQTVSNFFPKGDTRYLKLTGTAANSTLWNNQQYSATTLTTAPTVVLGFDGSTYRPTSVAGIQSFLGLGSNAYTSTAYLPLTGGTLSGTLNGTSASFTNSVSSNGAIGVQLNGSGTVGSGARYFLYNTSGQDGFLTQLNASNNMDFWGLTSNSFSTNPVITFTRTGGATFASLSGTGTRMVVADPSGVISTQTIPTGGGGGSVTGVAVATANGFSGTSDGASVVPTLTLSTTVNGIMQGNGTSVSAASTNGSGSVVLATSPTLTTPNIGAASASSLTSTGLITMANGIGIKNSTGDAGVYYSGGLMYLGRYSDGLGVAVTTSNGNTSISGTLSASNFSGTSSGTNTGDQTTITGNAGTATALQTARNIQGVSFNGTADINPINGTGFVKASGTTLSYDNTTYAPLNSPTFTGTPTLPTGTIAVTQSPGNNSTAIATTAYVDGALSSKTSRQLKDWYTDANNVTTTETDLYDYTVPSNTLVNNGDKLYFEIGGIYGGTANSKYLRLYFGNSGYLFQSTTASGSNWTIKGFIVKVDATNYRIVATNSDDAPEKISTYSSTGTVTNYTGTNVFKITGTGTASADITAKAGYLEFKPAAP